MVWKSMLWQNASQHSKLQGPPLKSHRVIGCVLMSEFLFISYFHLKDHWLICRPWRLNRCWQWKLTTQQHKPKIMIIIFCTVLLWNRLQFVNFKVIFIINIVIFSNGIWKSSAWSNNGNLSNLRWSALDWCNGFGTRIHWNRDPRIRLNGPMVDKLDGTWIPHWSRCWSSTQNRNSSFAMNWPFTILLNYT